MKTDITMGDVKMVNAQSNGMLHWAAFYGGRDHIEALVNWGADANLPNRFFGEAPLFWAVAAGNTAVLEALIEAGADKNSDAEGRLLLHLLAAQGRPER